MDKFECTEHIPELKIFGVGAMNGPYFALICSNCGKLLEYLPILTLDDLVEYLDERPRLPN